MDTVKPCDETLGQSHGVATPQVMRHCPTVETRLKPGQHVLAALRKMIVTGELRGGERIAEIPTAERLGVSRMPVRTALRALEQEGLVAKLGARGYAARTATLPQVESAIEVRGVLEGLAARLTAERHDRATAVGRLMAVLDEGETIFGTKPDQTEVDRFYRYNLAFHNELVAMSGNGAIPVALARNDHLPFASASAMAFDWRDQEWEREHLLTAHRQHFAVVDSIRDGDGDAAERLMREHARISLQSVSRFERLGFEMADVSSRIDAAR